MIVLWIILNTDAYGDELVAFRSNDEWLDDHRVHINAHGGGVISHEGTYYWFGEHKIAGWRGNTAQVGVHCYASDDLYNWRDAGVSLCVSDDPNSEIARGCIIERPKVLHNARTGKFVMWFHLELKGRGYDAARTGVAVADAVTGPYRYLRSFRPNAGKWPENMTPERRQKALDFSKATVRKADTEAVRADRYLVRDLAIGQMSRDMTLFRDEDGAAYHVHASEENLTLHIAELTPDYLDFTGRYVRVFPGESNEAPVLFKHCGRYYMITSGCTGWRPNAARSAVADSIWGPWHTLGNPCVGGGSREDLGREKTFGGQSTCVLPIQDKPGSFIALFDVWRPRNPIDGRYMWLPIVFTPDSALEIRYRAVWSLDVLEGKSP